jgi:hypothetical protein
MLQSCCNACRRPAPTNASFLCPTQPRLFCISVHVIFKLFQCLDQLQALCEKLKMGFLRLEGSTPTSKRVSMVDRFNNRHGPESMSIIQKWFLFISLCSCLSAELESGWCGSQYCGCIAPCALRHRLESSQRSAGLPLVNRHKFSHTSRPWLVYGGTVRSERCSFTDSSQRSVSWSLSVQMTDVRQGTIEEKIFQRQVSKQSQRFFLSFRPSTISRSQLCCAGQKQHEPSRVQH